MTAAARFALAELDLLTTHAGAPMPYPVQVPSHGRTAGERAAVLASAGATLVARDLADRTGPTGLAGALVTALRAPEPVDLVLTGGRDGPLGVLALRRERTALVCRQPLTPALAHLVEVVEIDRDGLVDELLRDVPALPGAPVVPVTLTREVVDAASGGADEDRLRALTRDAGGDPAELDRLAALLRGVSGRGQLGGAGRGGRIELSWLDSAAGRLRIDRGADGWVSVNPLHPNDVRRFLRALTGGGEQGERGGRP
ncbi:MULTISPECIES: ESX secretion-associated protein EspG [Actinosynnema]|uniref:ESX secretion-associated protein EspG n=1 Tax=Actinosynnema TaxID=40566 RepID=UPI0020A35783|nr:ESX secretion-associated protein EspG [Actinosynnema pretiosum]MCP2096218.1 EspG family protein [Actinosynnema pretiosum]